jgi:hypothetical protein
LVTFLKRLFKISHFGHFEEFVLHTELVNELAEFADVVGLFPEQLPILGSFWTPGNWDQEGLPEVPNAHVVIVHQKDIGQREVPVDNTVGVQVLEPQTNLHENLHDDFLRQHLQLRPQILREVSLGTVLGYQIDPALYH